MTSTSERRLVTRVRPSLARVVLGLALLAEAVLIGVICRPGDPAPAKDVLGYEALAAAGFVVAVAAFACSRLRTGPALWLIFTAAIVLNVLGMLVPPTSSDDDFRYAWDGKVQLSGIDPYRYTPEDPALVPLRDSFTFPTDRPCTHRVVVADGCTQINRPNVHTIYPPVAQAAFTVMRLVSFGGRGNHLPLQLAEVVCSLGISVLLTRNALRRGIGLWSVALWAWCPIAVLELANDAHVEGLAVLLSLAGVLTSARGRDRAAGFWVGAAIATKLYPALLLPAVMRRRPLLVAGAAIGLVVASYLPHVAVVGRDVIGYLPGYLQEGDYLSGGRFLLLNLGMSQSISPYLAALLLALVAYGVWRWGDPATPELGALQMVGAFFLIVTPNLSWYSLLLLALAALCARPEWLGVVAAPTVIYLGVKLHWDVTFIGPMSYAGGALLLVAAMLWRGRPAAPSAAGQTGRRSSVGRQSSGGRRSSESGVRSRGGDRQLGGLRSRDGVGSRDAGLSAGRTAVQLRAAVVGHQGVSPAVRSRPNSQ